MNLGIVYDLREDYGIDKEDITYKDFSVLSEIQGIYDALQKFGHNAELIGSPKMFSRLVQERQHENYDIIMNFCEGFRSRNRESLIPALCELYQIPYTFSDCHAMNLTLDKYQTLLFAKSIGLNIPESFLFIPNFHTWQDLSNLVQKLHFPIVCKPNYEGTSMGITLVYCMEDLKKTIEKLVEVYRQPILCSDYIDGHEIAVPIIGTGDHARILGIVEYQKLDGSPIEFYTSEQKEHGCHKRSFADFGEIVNKRIELHALHIHRAIPCFDLSRIDLRLRKGIPYLLEVTPLPDMTRNSTFEESALRCGYNYGELLNYIIISAIERYKGMSQHEYI